MSILLSPVISSSISMVRDGGEGWSDFQLVRAGQTTMGRSGLYADAYLIWKRRTQAQNNWLAFKTYWTDKFQEHKDINKLTSENAGFGENSEMGSETHDKTLDAAMENLVAIMSSEKPQVQTIFATNALLAK